MSLLPNFLDCFEYVNADAIAAGLSPLNPDSMAMEAGRLSYLIQVVILLLKLTLAARSFAPFIISCRAKSYTINLIYFWLKSVDLAVERVAARVASGGHSIPEDVIRIEQFNQIKEDIPLIIAEGKGIYLVVCQELIDE